jgi:Flp pilus assembly pilin Flp
MDINTKSLELAVRTQNAVEDLSDRVANRLQEQRGQTAAEYLGVLVVIAVIIGVLATTDIGDKLKTLITGMIDKISAGNGK